MAESIAPTAAESSAEAPNTESPASAPTSSPSPVNPGMDVFLAGIAGFAVVVMALALILMNQDKKWDEARRVMLAAHDRLTQLEKTNGGTVPEWIKDGASILIDLDIAKDGLHYFNRGEFIFHRMAEPAANAGSVSGEAVTEASSTSAESRRRWYIEIHAGSKEFEAGRFDAEGNRILDPPMGTARLYSTGEWDGPRPLPEDLRPEPRPATSSPSSAPKK